MPTIEERLARLEDERDILNLLYTYGHALDYGHEQAFMNCWTEDAYLEWTARPASFRGRAEILRAFREHSHAPIARHKHLLIEPLIEIRGDEAEIVSMFARLDSYGGLPKIRTFGRYLDRTRRCPDGRWRITYRKAESDVMRREAPDVFSLSQDAEALD